jgi:hypothetical protein
MSTVERLPAVAPKRGPAASGSTKRQPDELETQVANRKRELITEIIEHKKNSSRSGAVEAIGKIQHHLSELSQILQADDWASLSAGARLRLAEWIAR